MLILGDLGPVYGFQWRHSGADYVDCKTDYTGQGVDQLAEVIRTISERPWDRRMLIVAWCPRGSLIPSHCWLFGKRFRFLMCPKLLISVVFRYFKFYAYFCGFLIQL